MKPANLLVFLSDRCNMTCSYCFLSLNEGKASVLGAEALERACAEHLERHNRGRARFTFLGGEPLLHFERLLAAVRSLRARGGRGAAAPVTVVTNGTLACPKKLAALQDLGVSVTVSLDGGPGAHDSHRRLVAAGKPSLEPALLALESCDKSRLNANMVVREDTAGALLSNVEFLRSRGFSRLSFHLDVLEEWTETGLRVLERALDGFRRYARALESKGGELRLSHLAWAGGDGALSDGHGYDDLVLGADGRYYPCDGLFARPYSELGRWAVGDAASGVDWERRRAFHEEALAFIHARLEGAPHYTCPRETYFHALASGRDAGEAVRRFRRADAVIGGALAALTPGRAR